MINYKKHLTIQGYGTSLLVFIKADTTEAAYEIWLDLFNFGATGNTQGAKSNKENLFTEFVEPDYISDGVYSCWTTPEKLKKYFLARWTFRLSDDAKYKGVKGGVLKDAQRLANETFDSIDRDSYRSAGVPNDVYEFGTIAAEKEDLSFEEHCYRSAFAPS